MKKPDLGQRYTDAETLKLEREMKKVYKQAQKDIDAKTADFWARHAEKDAKYRTMVQNGKMSREDYDAWKQGQVFQGKQWQAKQEQIADVLYNANNAAHKMAEGRLTDVFTFNANYMSYDLENTAGVNYGLTMYDRATVSNLIKNKPNLLPKKKLDKAKDIRWNMKNIRGQVTQSIIQGESIDELAERLTKEMPNRSFKQARVHARTMMTSAQNAGRMESMRMHQEMGIESLKLWIATLDERTRWMHQELDGQTQEIDKPFEVGQYTIMYPADPNAAPAMVYNCRCTLGEEVKKYPNTDMTRRDNTIKPRDMKSSDDGVIPYMTYRQWENMKKAAAQTVTQAAATAQDVQAAQAAVMSAQFAADAWDDDVKGAAYDFVHKRDADDLLRPYFESISEDLTAEEKTAVWIYTSDSDPMNLPLSGQEGSWRNSDFVGYDKANWNYSNDYRGVNENAGFVDTGYMGEDIKNLTTAIDKSTLQDGIILHRGGGYGGLSGMIEGGGSMTRQEARDMLDRGDPDEIIATLTDSMCKNNAFTSTGASKQGSFSGEVRYNIYAPQGTHGLYVEPQSYFGRTAESKLFELGDTAHGIGENEVLLQRGTEFKITNVEVDGSRITIDMDVVKQPDYFRFGDEDTFNNGLTRHKVR